VCYHDAREVIELAISRGAPHISIERQYGISRMTVARHAESCFTAKMAVVVAKRAEELGAATLLDELLALNKRTYDLLARAETDGSKPTDVARLVREARENLATIGKLTGAFPKEAAGTTNIDARTQNVVIPGLKDLSAIELRQLIGSLQDRRSRDASD